MEPIVKYTESKATKKLILSNTENTSEFEDYITVEENESIGIRIQTYNDGRVYYTAFRHHNNKFYCSTTMIRDGKIYPNTGGLHASGEIESYMINKL